MCDQGVTLDQVAVIVVVSVFAIGYVNYSRCSHVVSLVLFTHQHVRNRLGPLLTRRLADIPWHVVFRTYIRFRIVVFFAFILPRTREALQQDRAMLYDTVEGHSDVSISDGQMTRAASSEYMDYGAMSASPRPRNNWAQ